MDPETQAKELSLALLNLCNGYPCGVILASLASVTGVTLGALVRDRREALRAFRSVQDGTHRIMLSTIADLDGADGAG